MLRGTRVAASATVKRDRRFQISNPTFYLNKLEEEQTKPQAAGGRNEKEHEHRAGTAEGNRTQNTGSSKRRTTRAELWPDRPDRHEGRLPLTNSGAEVEPRRR